MNKIASQFYDNGWIDFKTDLKLKPLDIFQNHKDLFGLGNIDEMRLIAEIHDKSGTDHYRFQQYFKGIKVEGMTYSIHSKNDVSYCANGKLAPNLELEVNPKISIDEAKTSVINHPLIAKLSGKILPYVPIKNDSLVITSNLFNNSTTITNFSLVYCLKFNDTMYPPAELHL